jgi:AcrR family transcriptional regulator
VRPALRAADRKFFSTDRTFSEVNVTRSKEEVVQEFRVHSIQEAAMRVIARKGMASATMQEIAEEAGVAKGTIYLYFRDREELVEKTFETAINELHQRIDAALDAEGTFEQKLRNVITAQIMYFSQNREFFRLYHSLRMPEGTATQQRRQKRTCQPQFRSRVERLASVLSDAMAAGEVRPVDPFRLALFVVEGTIAVVLERLSEDAPPPENEDVELIVSTLLGGIVTPKARRSSH